MSDLRTAAQQALEALGTWEKPPARLYRVMDNLRATLAQEQAEHDAYPYASCLATSIWEKHYKGEAPNWKPLDDLMGVLTQIDNMTTGLTRQGQVQAEPVASLMTHVQSGDVEVVWNDDGFDRELWHETPLYTAPPQRQPLTQEESDNIYREYMLYQDRLTPSVLQRVVRAVERAHGIGENT